MSKRAGGWKRQSWQDAEREIGQAVGLTVQTTDQVVLIPDEQVEDSPYQARVGYNDAQVADLAQSMRETGFQGVLFVRAHPGGPEGGRPRYQLVFGHRRRRAWRVVCAERDTPCTLPAIVRKVSARQLLTIGAQENLQREDLNPVVVGSHLTASCARPVSGNSRNQEPPLFVTQERMNCAGYYAAPALALAEH